MLADIICNVPKIKDDGLSVNDIATIIIAAVNLVLAFYVFIYQRHKDKKSDYTTAVLNEKNINLQWFKDIIIQPHFKILTDNFEELVNLPNNFVPPSDPNYDNQVTAYLVTLKLNLYAVRKKFLVLFEVADLTLFKKSIAVMDNLLDNITTNLVDNRLDISQPAIYEDFIIKEILNTKNSLIKLIYTFKG